MPEAALRLELVSSVEFSEDVRGLESHEGCRHAIFLTAGEEEVGDNLVDDDNNKNLGNVVIKPPSNR